MNVSDIILFLFLDSALCKTQYQAACTQSQVSHTSSSRTLEVGVKGEPVGGAMPWEVGETVVGVTEVGETEGEVVVLGA